MSEYISREAAVEAVEIALNKYNLLLSTFRVIRDSVKDVPAADVAPVVHARWVFEDEDDYRPRCAKCDHIASGDSENYYLSNYCPNCGACMKEEQDND